MLSLWITRLVVANPSQSVRCLVTSRATRPSRSSGWKKLWWKVAQNQKRLQSVAMYKSLLEEEAMSKYKPPPRREQVWPLTQFWFSLIFLASHRRGCYSLAFLRVTSSSRSESRTHDEGLFGLTMPPPFKSPARPQPRFVRCTRYRVVQRCKDTEWRTKRGGPRV